VVIKAAVLIESDHQQGRFPKLFIRANRIIDIGDQLLAFHDVMRWMVVVLILTCILRFDQGEFRKVIGFQVGDVLEELIYLVVLQKILEFRVDA